MKKFFIIVTVIILSVLLKQYLEVYHDVYIDLNPDAPIEVLFTADSEHIYVDGQAEPFVIKGVLMDGSLPGHYTTDYPIGYERYLDWFSQIHEMGANTVEVYTIMDSAFYRALHDFNIESESPIYLLQGIVATDYELNNYDDLYYAEQSLLADTKRAVDVIHGNEVLSIGRFESSDASYISDVSDWVLGYIIGNDWISYTVAYTDHREGLPASYEGEYFYTDEGASNTEVLLARVMDELLSYEAHRYKSQRLVTFNNSLTTDPLEYTRTVQLQLEKFASMDIANILPTDSLQSGYFAGFVMRAGMRDFLNCLSDDDFLEYTDIIMQVNTDTIYDGYVDFLNKKYDIPVVVTNYGYSTARVVDVISEFDEDRHNEQEQGEALVETYYEFLEVGCQGAVIATWQDNWSRTTWNTAFSTDTDQQKSWYDAQAKDQSYGILSFVPEDIVGYVDGDASEWGAEDIITSQEGYEISARYDTGYVYFMIRAQEENDITAPIVVPIDVSPDNGSYTVRDSEYRFSELADFAMVFGDDEGARLMVQTRYSAARANFEEQISTTNPYVFPPSETGNLFEPVEVVAQQPLRPDVDLEQYDLAIEHTLLNTFLTGMLREGNANPNMPDYDSLADYCYGDGVLEVRIPWQMLNYFDPTDAKIHDDYYDYYGVIGTDSDGIMVGVNSALSDNRTVLAPFEIEALGDSVDYQERLKLSYDIVKEAWTQ